MFSILCLLGLSSIAAEDLSLSETSYSGASILIGDSDVTFGDVYNHEDISDPHAYSFFEGNTLYIGNSDDYGNSIDGILEFFWFQSSIDRGTDFYVAVIKTRASPGDDCYAIPWVSGFDCHLWADELQDFGEYPVISVEAYTDISREAGAFRWDWSVPFENYGIDAYGQVTFQSQYGIGANAEGSAMAHGSYQLDEAGAIQASGDIQVKGYVGSEYKVQTQYEVTLYEWDVFVDGRANLMAWDMYLNLGARDAQSAYHEYFLAIQVEEGETFKIDQLAFTSYFDVGWWNPLSHELGLVLNDVEIMPPVYMPTDEETEEPAELEDTGEETETEPKDTSEEEDEGNITDIDDGPIELERSDGEVVKNCSTVKSKFNILYILLSILIIIKRRI